MIFMKKFLRWFWRPRTIFIIGFPLATIFTLLALIVVIVNVRGRHAWEAYATEARARGVKLSLHELLPPPVPDAENFAAVPLFANVFSDDQAAREKAGKALALPSDDKGKPAISSIGDAHLIDLTEWQAAFVQSKDLPAVGGDPASDVLQAIEHRCGPALIELAEAELEPGVYALSNHTLNEPWPKVTMAKSALDAILQAEMPEKARQMAIYTFLSNNSVAPDATLPTTGVGIEWERVLSPALIVTAQYGTRASTMLSIANDDTVSFEEHTRSPDGAVNHVAEFRFDLRND